MGIISKQTNAATAIPSPLSPVIPTPDGGTSAYHIIQRMDCYPIDGVVDVTINSYISQGTFQAGDSPNAVWAQRVNYSDIGQGLTDISQAAIYTYVATLPEWSGK